MGLTAAQKRVRNAGYQRAWRLRRDAEMKARPEVVERELLAAAERCGVLSAEDRRVLADRLQDLAMRHFHAMHRLNEMAKRVRAG